MSSTQASTSSASDGKGRGRPPAAIKEYFTSNGVVDKHNRYNHTCKFCPAQFISGKKADLEKHILEVCKGVSNNIREELRDEIAKRAADTGPTSTAGRKELKNKAEGEAGDRPPKKQSHLSRAFDNQPVGREQKKILDSKLCKLLVMCGIPWNVVDSSFFLDFTTELRPNYMPAGSYTLRNTVLVEEYAKAKADLHQKLKHEYNITFTLDGWTDANNRSVYAVGLVLQDGNCYLWDVQDFSMDIHHAEFIAEYIKKEMTKIGADKIGALVTDNPAVTQKARRLVVASPGFTHIVELRCMMHAFSLVMGSLLGHPWACKVVTDAQKVVTYFRASHRPLALLKQAATSMGINSTLETSNTTRFTSVYNCLESVRRHEQPFHHVVQQHGQDISQDAVKLILSDRYFWLKVEALCKLLKPYAEVIYGIQGNRSSMATITLCWLYLARKIAVDIEGLDAGGQDAL
eukprot:jgi/Chrzof1/3680/Cz13g04240.t1